MDKRFSGKVAIVTGGSRGIGEAIVRRLAQEGARVYATFNSNGEKALAIEQELNNSGASVRFISADISNEDSVKNLMDTVINETGRIDVLVNNAGMTRDNLLMRMSTQEWDDVINTNLKGVFLCCKAVTRTMMSQRKGKIVNVSSIVGFTGNAGQANYVAAKAGVIGFTKSLAKELSSRNILVNCIAPGYVETDMTQKLSEQQKQSFLDIIPLRRAAQADEIASVVAFLVSDDANYITGQTIAVDGGLTMY